MSLHGVSNEIYEAIIGYDRHDECFLLFVCHANGDRSGQERFLFNSAVNPHDFRMTIQDLRKELGKYGLVIAAELLKILYREALLGGFFTKLDPADFEPQDERETVASYF